MMFTNEAQLLGGPNELTRANLLAGPTGTNLADMAVLTAE